MKKIILLGITGSIGMQTLDIIRMNPKNYQLIGMSLGSNLDKSIQIIEEFQPKFLSLRNDGQEKDIKTKFPHIMIYKGQDALVRMIEQNSNRNHLLVNALMGSVGLIPTVTAIKRGSDIAIANKETLVIAGEIINELVKKHHVNLFPIDSEHSAILQCLQGERRTDIEEIIITASGGTFRDKKREELKSMTVEDTLHHPNWKMGAKITVDSATMMNKGLEVIEAHYLFDVDYDHIKTLIHRESIIHSMVKFKDHSVKAQLGLSDMRIPISYALSYPERLSFVESDIDFVKIGKLTFEEMSLERFPLLRLAYECGRKKGNMPCILNACNEACVHLFLEKKISFLQIEEIILKEISQFEYQKEINLESLLNLDREVKAKIFAKYGGM